MAIEMRNFIDGTFVPAASRETLEVLEPATGAVHATAPDSGPADVEAAVDAARRAFPDWAARPAAERSATLIRIAELIEANLDDLARAESDDTGKPVALARAVDIPRAAANFRFFAGAILHDDGTSHATDHPQRAINFVHREPRGVAGLISPWNLPLYLFTWKIAPALATGNTVVGKPSEVTPLTASRLCELATEAELPPGVLNVVHGRGATAGSSLVGHPDVPTISFTGGTATGRAIAAAAAPMFKRLSLELGGKNPVLVFDDADLDEAIPASVRSAFANQGEICLCGSRILVQRPIFDAFVERYVERTRRLRVGDPRERSSNLGAVVSAAHLDKIRGYVATARELGGEILVGGGVPDPGTLGERCRRGWFHEPTVIVGLDADCRVEQEEIFGPVVTIAPFDDEQEALARANGTPYGLAATVWTTRLDRAHRVASRLEAGIIWVNCWMLRDLRTPFGGMKQSGVGREGGTEALRFFTEPRNICIAY